MVPVKHWKQEVSEGLSLILPDSVLLNEHLLKWPIVETGDSSQVTIGEEELLKVLSRLGEVLWHLSQEFHHLGKMVVILVVILALSWLKQEVTGNHLENGASK